MKIVIPVAGMGTRLQPHTFSTPKSLMHVAGKRILGHILGSLKDIDAEEAIFVTGPMGEQDPRVCQIELLAQDEIR